jgi:sugar lactone lactonase YvrE
VHPNGRVELLAGVPLPPAGGFPGDAVPTCVAQASGTTYVADLAGRLWKWQGTTKVHGKKGSSPPSTLPLLTQVTVAAGLLHHVTGCASDSAGNLYLVDMWGKPGPPVPAGPASAANTGSVVMIAPAGQATVLASGLNFPNQVAAGANGTLYVSMNSTCPAVGSSFPYCSAGGTLVTLTRS